MLKVQFKIICTALYLAVLLFLGACSKDKNTAFESDINTDGSAYKTIKATAHHFYWQNATLVDTTASNVSIKLFASEQDREFDNKPIFSAKTDSFGKYNFTFLKDSLYFIQAAYLDIQVQENVNFNASGDILFLELDFY